MADADMRKSMIYDLMHPGKLLGLLKNKYGSFVLQKACGYLNSVQKEEMKVFLESKINVTSSKEKTRVNAFFDMLAEL